MLAAPPQYRGPEDADPVGGLLRRIDDTNPDAADEQYPALAFAYVDSVTAFPLQAPDS